MVLSSWRVQASPSEASLGSPSLPLPRVQLRPFLSKHMFLAADLVSIFKKLELSRQIHCRCQVGILSSDTLTTRGKNLLVSQPCPQATRPPSALSQL